MKKLILITGCMAIVCILLTGHTAADADNSNSSAQIRNTASAQEVSLSPHYLLRVYDKRVAAFYSDSTTPFFISDVYVSELPKKDRQLLIQGLQVNSRKELDRLLEDYCS